VLAAVAQPAETAATAPAIAFGLKKGTLAVGADADVAIVDPNGDLVYFEKMDDTVIQSTIVCQTKARSSARFARPTLAAASFWSSL